MTQSFNNQSVNDVALTLARRKVGLRHGLAKPMDKLAYDLSSSLQGAGDWLRKNPAAQKALIGAGVGGTLGLGSSLFRREKKRHPWRDALTGALAGGALGGGVGLLSDRGRIPDQIFPATPNTDELAKDIAEIQNLEQQAKPTFLNSPVHWALQTAKEHPILTTLGIGGGIDVGTGMHIAAQGKNVSPGAWQNVSKTLADQLELKGTVDKTQIGQLLDRYGTDIKRWESAAKGPGKLEVVRRDNPLLQALLGGDQAEIAEALKNLKDPVTGKPMDPREVMGRLKNVKGVYNPMTASQYALQEAHAGRTGGSTGKVGWKPNTWQPLKRGWGRLTPKYQGYARNVTSHGMFPKSLPNIPKSLGGRWGTALGIPAALIASWLLAKGHANTEGAQDKIRDIQRQFGN